MEKRDKSRRCHTRNNSLGTAIAAFNENGKYPICARHAAFYISHNTFGIMYMTNGMDKEKFENRQLLTRKVK